MEVEEGMDMFVNNPVKVEGEPKGVGVFLQGGDAGVTSFFIRYVDDDPPYGLFPGGGGFNTGYLYVPMGVIPGGFW